jgi:hypothetical protein
MKKSIKTNVNDFIIKKSIVNLNQYNSSYKNTPLCYMIEEYIKDEIETLTSTDDFYVGIGEMYPNIVENNDIRKLKEVESYYISGYKDEYDYVELTKHSLVSSISKNLIGKFSLYLRENLLKIQKDEILDFVKALDIIYKYDSSIEKSYKLCKTLFKEYWSEDNNQSQFEISERIIDNGFHKSDHYNDWLIWLKDRVTNRLKVTKKSATYSLLDSLYNDRKKVFSDTFGSDFEKKLERYIESKTLIDNLENHLNKLSYEI